jgi:hypothetical protein
MCSRYSNQKVHKSNVEVKDLHLFQSDNLLHKIKVNSITRLLEWRNK